MLVSVFLEIEDNSEIRVFFSDWRFIFRFPLSVLQAIHMTLEVTWKSNHTAFPRHQISPSSEDLNIEASSCRVKFRLSNTL